MACRQREEIKLGHVSFSTFTKAQEFISTILRQHKNRELTGKTFDVVKDLLMRHPRAEEKIGPGLQSLFVKETPNVRGINRSNCYCFYVHRVDGSSVDFSYKSCLQRPKTLSQEIRINRQSAYRAAVDKQIIKFKDPIDDKECALCGTSWRLEVDHVVQFVDLIREFEVNEEILPTVFADDPVRHYAKFRREDKEFEKRWARFHKKKANLRILCMSCNRSRPRPKSYVNEEEPILNVQTA